MNDYVGILLDALETLESNPSGDTEANHVAADGLLLEIIAGLDASTGARARTAFYSIKKWYA